ncbi:ribulose-bisphosphate carboxylase large subunit family protein [soil metagenome]
MHTNPLLASDRFVADYLIETIADPQRICEQMAGEQSTSTSTRVQGETDALVRAHGAHVEHIELLDRADAISLPTHEYRGQPVQRARVRLSWPMKNVGSSLPMLQTTLLGNQVGMSGLTGIRLEHLQVPDSLVKASARPAFGIAGTRRLAGVYGRPLIGTIVKPNIGLSPEQTAEVVRQLIEGGIDFIKDDELIASPPYSPLAKRVECVMRVVNEAAERTGRKVMVACNITGDVDEMRAHHDVVVAHGGTCAMVNLNAAGIAGIVALRRHSAVALHGHRAGWAMLTRCPALGMNFQPYQLLHRLAGIDQLHVSGLGGKFWEESTSIVESARECLTQIDQADGANDDRAMPVFSGGSTVFEAQPTFDAIGTADIIFAAGGAVLGHPGGIGAGVVSLREAWAAAMAGVSLDEQSSRSPELAQAMHNWAARRRAA